MGGGSGRPLSVVSLALGADTGGGSYRTAAAFKRHAPDWHVRSMVVSRNYIGYPEDVTWSRGRAQKFYEEVDVVHAHNSFAGFHHYERMAIRRRRRPRPPFVLHHHGTTLRGSILDGTSVDLWRETAKPLVAEAQARNAVQIASTIDLSILAPDGLIEWMPTPYDMDWLKLIGDQYRRPADDGRIVIAHAPTSRLIKSTDEFLRAVANIRRRHPNVEVDLIEGVSWNECLRRKAMADIFYDQTVLGYGCNAIESWAMGLPVVAGTTYPEVRTAMIDRWGQLPFMEATPTTIEDALDALVRDVDLRAFYGRLGRSHAHRWHSEAVVVERMKEVYTRAVESFAEAVA